MTKVLFVSHSSGAAGAEQSLLALVRSTAARGTVVDVIVPAATGRLNRQLGGIDGVSLTTLPVRQWAGRRHRGVVSLVRMFQALSQVPGLCCLLRRLDPDVVVVNTSTMPGPVLAGRLTSTPTVVIARESVRDNQSLQSAMPHRWRSRLLCRWADEVVSISRYVDEQWGHRTTVIPEVETRTVRRPSQDPPPPAGQEVPSDAPTRLAMFGTIGPDKGQEDAVLAMMQARRQGYDVSLDIYGEGQDADVRSLRALVEEQRADPHVAMKPWVRDAGAAMRTYDATVVCSRAEAFGRVTVESLAVGTPVLAYAAGATTEILAGGGGMLVEPSWDSLGLAMAAISSDRTLLVGMRRECRSRDLTDEIQRSVERYVDRVLAHAGRAASGAPAEQVSNSEA